MFEEIFYDLKTAQTEFEIRRAEALYDLYVQEQERTAPKPKGLTINELLNKVSDGIVNALPVLMPLLQQLSAISQMQNEEPICMECIQAETEHYARCIEIARKESFRQWFISRDFENKTPEEKEMTYLAFLSEWNQKAVIEIVEKYVSQYDNQKQDVEGSTPDEETHFEVPLPPVVSSDGKTFIPKKRKPETTTI